MVNHNNIVLLLLYKVQTTYKLKHKGSVVLVCMLAERECSGNSFAGVQSLHQHRCCFTSSG